MRFMLCQFAGDCAALRITPQVKPSAWKTVGPVHTMAVSKSLGQSASSLSEEAWRPWYVISIVQQRACVRQARAAAGLDEDTGRAIGARASGRGHRKAQDPL